MLTFSLSTVASKSSYLFDVCAIHFSIVFFLVNDVQKASILSMPVN